MQWTGLELTFVLYPLTSPSHLTNRHHSLILAAPTLRSSPGRPRPPPTRSDPSLTSQFMSSTNNTIGEKVGAATGNTVGQESLLSEAQKVAGHAVEYAKATVGLGGHKAADSVQDATNNSQGGSFAPLLLSLSLSPFPAN